MNFFNPLMHKTLDARALNLSMPTARIIFCRCQGRIQHTKTSEGVNTSHSFLLIACALCLNNLLYEDKKPYRQNDHKLLLANAPNMGCPFCFHSDICSGINYGKHGFIKAAAPSRMRAALNRQWGCIVFVISALMSRTNWAAIPCNDQSHVFHPLVFLEFLERSIRGVSHVEFNSWGIHIFLRNQP